MNATLPGFTCHSLFKSRFQAQVVAPAMQVPEVQQVTAELAVAAVAVELA